MTDLIFVGIQGSGKGTQAKILAEKKGAIVFETGRQLRALAKENSELGRKIKDITTRGDLVSNDIVMEIVENFINSITEEDTVIFDGIPRSEEQRVTLEALLKKHHRTFKVLEIKLSEEEAMNRLLKRAEIEGRADDNPESIKKRIINFHTHTKPLLDAWRAQEKLIVINGEQGVDEVSKDIINAVQ